MNASRKEGLEQMKRTKTRVPGRAHEIAETCRMRIFSACCAAFGVLLILGICFLAGCGDNSSESVATKKLVAHDAIKLDGGTASESYLKISSTTEGEAAVSVTNGGHLTLHDATIWKIGDEASGSPTFGMSGGRSSPSQDSGPPPPGEAAGTIGSPDSGMPGGVLAGGLMPQGDMRGNAYPGPGATHAGVFAGSGGGIDLENVSIETAIGEGGGIYASGKGSSIRLVNGTITTDGSTAHGVFVTHRGRVSVENVTIITKGEHSSALATYQGNGTVTATGGTYTAFGKYSAGIYSAGDISVSDVVCKSVLDNAAVVEGGSRIMLTDSILWSREKGAVMIYQSFSGNAAMGPSQFNMTGGSITADDGPIFYITNTTGTIILKNVELYGDSGVLLKALKGDWGADIAWAKPTRGGTLTFIADEQTLPGDIVVDEFSSVFATFKNRTTLTGAINTDNKGKNVSLTLDTSSQWDVTADSYLTGLTFSDGISDSGITNIIGNGHTVYYDRRTSPALGGKVYDLPKGGKLMPK